MGGLWEPSVEVLFLRKGFTQPSAHDLKGVNSASRAVEGWLVVTSSLGRSSPTPTPKSKHVHFLVLFGTGGLFLVYFYLPGVAPGRWHKV